MSPGPQDGIGESLFIDVQQRSFSVLAVLGYSKTDSLKLSHSRKVVHTVINELLQFFKRGGYQDKVIGECQGVDLSFADQRCDVLGQRTEEPIYNEIEENGQ